MLHGASGLPEEVMRRAIRAGVCKLNVNTQVRAAGRAAMVERLESGEDLLGVMKGSEKAMRGEVGRVLREFGWG